MQTICILLHCVYVGGPVAANALRELGCETYVIRFRLLLAEDPKYLSPSPPPFRPSLLPSLPYPHPVGGKCGGREHKVC